ncbi:Cyclin-P3-1 like [Heracleum sosnowskyi]|uniref:Cyclin-P3-1 like n=1 Tax=Heracleum sosnowskyi TaxID=360622 RepID=A0AAD8GPH6_9APIA|nr:Cyclin-P3-1 like [Heracleum sosnowskyi]
MGTLALEVETLASDICLGLGLQDLGKRSPRNPRVLSLLSSYLEKSVQSNEKLMENTEIKDAVTIFHGSKAPALGIQQYINRIFKYSCCSPSCFVVAQIYVDRFVQRTNLQLTSLNVHRLLITSVMVAAKFIDDAFFNNAYYAKVGGVSTAEINKLEMKFLFALDFRLNVSLQTFGMYCSQLEKEVCTGPPVERPMRTCGIKDCWQNSEDSVCSQTIAR